MKWWLSLLGLSSVCWLCVAGERGLPSQEGIGNFGKVSNSLYRGAQPDEFGMQSLKRMGVKMIINLRMSGDCWKAEEALATSYGIGFTNVPFKGLGRPADKQVRMVLDMIQGSISPVFVHCQHGCDRTGTIIACYRIQHDGWSSDTALQEAGKYGMSKLERGMRRYVLDFGRQSKQFAAAVVK